MIFSSTPLNFNLKKNYFKTDWEIYISRSNRNIDNGSDLVMCISNHNLVFINFVLEEPKKSRHWFCLNLWIHRFKWLKTVSALDVMDTMKMTEKEM